MLSSVLIGIDLIGFWGWGVNLKYLLSYNVVGVPSDHLFDPLCGCLLTDGSLGSRLVDPIPSPASVAPRATSHLRLPSSDSSFRAPGTFVSLFLDYDARYGGTG